jgi:organic radical activating enzyme
MIEEDKFQQHLNKTYIEINEVSPSFCVAKWKQVTMHLHNGHTHSCHHPTTHLVPLEELKTNPTALHNTNFKKQQRKMMLEGERPKECDYCWRAEDSGNKFSDRTYKSADPSWAYGHIQDIAHKLWAEDVDPSYVEVSFSSVCNFKCSYCSPNISSQWMEEIERHGPYPTSKQFNNIEWFKQTKQMPIPNNQDNPYVDAFWQWWPKMYKELKQFRITGGEPLLNKNTFKVLDYIIENPNPDLVFSINTNMNPPPELLDKFIEKLKIIQEGKMVQRLHLFTSAEAQGKQAEYIRHGLDYDLWLTNIERVIQEVPKVAFTIMCTYNLLSIPSYKGLLDDILNIRRKYRDLAIRNQRTPIMIDIPYLRFPPHQAPFIAPKSLIHFVEDQIKFMEDNLEIGHVKPQESWKGFHELEIYKLRRILNIMNAELEAPNIELETWRKDFVIFVDEHDKRRGTNFLETYPELAEVYHEWKQM